MAEQKGIKKRRATESEKVRQKARTTMNKLKQKKRLTLWLAKRKARAVATEQYSRGAGAHRNFLLRDAAAGQGITVGELKKRMVAQ